MVRVTLFRRILFKVELKFFLTIPAFDILTSTSVTQGQVPKTIITYLSTNRLQQVSIKNQENRQGLFLPITQRQSKKEDHWRHFLSYKCCFVSVTLSSCILS